MNISQVFDNISDAFYQKFFRYKLAVKIITAIFIALVILLMYQFSAVQRLEYLTVDYRFLMRPFLPIKAGIVFIDMYEDSIDAIGRWPWPRKWHGAMTKILSEYEPKAIAFDVIFAEPQDEINDSTFEDAIKLSGKVYLPLSYDLTVWQGAKVYQGEGVRADIRPLERFARWTKGVGHISAVPDRDGILRRIYPVISIDGVKNYQLGLKLACDVLGIPEEGIVFDAAKHRIILRKPGGKEIRVPLDDDNQLIINWKTKWGKELPHYSYIDVIRSYGMLKDGKEPLIDLATLKDKVCIIGLTSLGLYDIKPIPIESTYPAVGVNAMVAASILNNDFVRSTHREADILIIVFVSIFFTFLLAELRPLGGMLAATISIIGYFLVSSVIFSVFNLLIITFYPMLAIFLAYALTATYTQILQSVERSRLFKQATRDGMTGLYNVRHFNLLLEAEMKIASFEKGRRMSILMFDIDNFKKLNDTYGHQSGDIVLRDFAKLMQSKCRQTDIVARYGGEEFIIMLVGAGKKEAADVAEKIRSGFEVKRYRFGNDNYGTSVSIGVAVYSGEKVREEFVEKADKALYQAKHGGKNRYCISGEAPASPPMAPEGAPH